MALKYPSKGGDDFKRVSPGSHLAICDIVADIGWQPGSGTYPKPKRTLFVRFEVPGERTDDDRPMVIHNFFTASMSKKANLRIALENWRGRKFTDDEAEDFDVAALLGKAVLISVVEKDSGEKTYSNIANLSKLPKGMEAPPPENPLLYFGPDDTSKYRDLPEWIRKKIDAQLKEPESTDTHSGSSHGDFVDDDIPF